MLKALDQFRIITVDLGITVNALIAVGKNIFFTHLTGLIAEIFGRIIFGFV